MQRVTLDISPSECLTQVEISSWNELLWTIQAAPLARSLHFQFQDVQSVWSRYCLERFWRIAATRRHMGLNPSSEVNCMLCWVLNIHLGVIIRESKTYQ
ncbi:hypothetical protein DL95DRAFT_394511 [Leptodontidium sp. 2 PMI_412]|nr:hypothetical protein DL95DRAFT_394511 [Leptodontidium sp. 2 PMI_412]